MEKQGLETKILEQSRPQKNGFLSRAKRAIGKGLSILALPVILGVSSLAGCKPYVIPNQPPTSASLYLTPSSGPVPLETEAVTDFVDPDGAEDFVEYEAFANYDNDDDLEPNERIYGPESVPPERLTLTKSGDYNVVVVGRDSAGHEIRAPARVTPSESPQSHNVNFSNVEDYLSNMDEESAGVIALPATDESGNPVTYDGVVESLDDKVSASVSEGKLNVTGNQNKTGEYALQVTYTRNGVQGTARLGGYLYNFPDISGTVESNEEDGVGKQGIARVYDENKNPLSNISINNGKGSVANGIIQTTPTGEFDFQINKRVEDLSEILLQTGIGNYVQTATTATDGIVLLANSVSDSYIETSSLAPGNHSLGAVRSVPYAGLAENGISADQFKSHEMEISGSTMNRWYFGNSPNLPKFNGVRILRNNYDAGNGSFNDTDAIRQQFLDQNDVGGLFDGNLTANQIEIFSDWNELVASLGGTLANANVLIIEPQKNLEYAGLTDALSIDGATGYIKNYARCRIKVDANGNIVSPIALDHEVYHGLGAQGHARTLGRLVDVAPIGQGPEDYYDDYFKKTILTEVINFSTEPSILDFKEAKMRHEENYSPGEVENHLGRKFY